MKWEMTVSLVTAMLLHVVVLFGFRMHTEARPLAISEEPAAEEVSLVEAEPEAETPPAPLPVATPEPVDPEPTPEVPTPPPDMSTPPPAEPAPDQEAMQVPESTPEPERPKIQPRHLKPTVPHAGAGSAAELAGAASHGASRGPLSSHASYLSNPKPDYPPDARRQRQEGVVLVNVEVGADGRAGDVSVGRSSGFPLLDDAAVRAVRRWLFEPARAGGVPVASRVEVPVRFSLAR